MEQKTTGEKFRLWLEQTMKITAKYFKARLLISLIIWVSVSAAYCLLGFPLWGLLGFAVGLGNLVPYVGPWASALVVGLVLIFQSPLSVVYGLLVIIVVQVVDEFLLTPLLMGNALDFKPLAVFAVLLLGGTLCGFWGLVFALPIAAALKIAYFIFIKNKEPIAAGEPQRYADQDEVKK